LEGDSLYVLLMVLSLRRDPGRRSRSKAAAPALQGVQPAIYLRTQLPLHVDAIMQLQDSEGAPAAPVGPSQLYQALVNAEEALHHHIAPQIDAEASRLSRSRRMHAADGAGGQALRSAIGATDGTAVLMGPKGGTVQTVSWGDAPDAPVSSALGHAAVPVHTLEHTMHGTRVLSATFRGLQGPHNIVLGSTGLWCATSASAAAIVLCVLYGGAGM
jgi:hypothetical protein